MAVTWVATGAKSAGGTTTISIASPAGTAAGQMLLAGRVTWVIETTFNDETDWTPVFSIWGGTGSSADNHNTSVRVDRRELTGSLAGPTVFDQTNLNGGLGIMLSYQLNSGGTWGVDLTVGDDNTHGANRSITAGGDLDLAPGDVVVAFVGVDTDTALAAFSGEAITATGGITFGATTRRTSGAGVGTGSDGNVEVFEATVSSGSSSTAVPTVVFTTSTSQCGPAVFVRLREVPGDIEVDLGTATEQEFGNPITPVKPIFKAVGTATEQELGLEVSPLRSVPVETATEVELGDTITPVKPILVDVETATEVELGQTITPVKPIDVAVGTATEVELGQTITPALAISVAVGTATEVELGRSITPITATAVVVGTATETELGQPITPVLNRAVAVETATEVELGQTLTPVKPILIDVEPATEVELGGTIAPFQGTQFIPRVDCAILEVGVACAILEVGVEPAILSVPVTCEIVDVYGQEH